MSCHIDLEMITTDNIDKFILFRRIQINRKDILNDLHTLYVLAILRQAKTGYSILSIAIDLRKIKRATANNLINHALKNLIAAGYARQNSRGSLYYITQEGLQALKDFNNSIECADYVNYNKKPSISKKVKRPGL
jgi:predicted transcriptional regulator